MFIFLHVLMNFSNKKFVNSGTGGSEWAIRVELIRVKCSIIMTPGGNKKVLFES